MAKDPKLRPVQTATGWRVNVPRDLSETGKRQRRDFSTEKDAERFASKLRTRYRKGIRSALLTTEQALQAEQAIRLLEPLGISLIEAARTVQRRHNEATRRELFKEAWLAYVTEGELRWSAVYSTTIGRIPDWVGPEFMALPIHEITDATIEAALFARNTKAKSTIKARTGIIKSVINGKGAQRKAKDIKIMSIAQVAKALRATRTPAERRTVALLLFAGIRPFVGSGEIMRLQWESIEGDHIYVSPEVSKTGTDRHIPITPRLARLIRGHPSSGPVVPTNYKRRIDRIRKDAGISGEADITRHTFASHFLSAYGEEATKNAMGHTQGSSTLFRHYRRSVTREQGLSYLGIKGLVAFTASNTGVDQDFKDSQAFKSS